MKFIWDIWIPMETWKINWAIGVTALKCAVRHILWLRPRKLLTIRRLEMGWWPKQMAGKKSQWGAVMLVSDSTPAPALVGKRLRGSWSCEEHRQHHHYQSLQHPWKQKSQQPFESSILNEASKRHFPWPLVCELGSWVGDGRWILQCNVTHRKMFQGLELHGCS